MQTSETHQTTYVPAWPTTVLESLSGALCGHVINSINQYMHPGKVILGMSATVVINPSQAAVCSMIFAIFDRVVLGLVPHHLKNNPQIQLVRISASVMTSATVSSAIFGISFNLAAGVIASSIIATTILLGAAKVYNQLVHEHAVAAKKHKPERL